MEGLQPYRQSYIHFSYQATLNRVVVAARSASANTYLLLYTYIMFHYTHTLCVHSLYALEEKAPQSEPQNLHFNYLTPSVTLHKTSCIFTHTFLKISCVQTHRCNRIHCVLPCLRSRSAREARIRLAGVSGLSGTWSYLLSLDKKVDGLRRKKIETRHLRRTRVRDTIIR